MWAATGWLAARRAVQGSAGLRNAALHAQCRLSTMPGRPSHPQALQPTVLKHHQGSAGGHVHAQAGSIQSAAETAFAGHQGQGTVKVAAADALPSRLIIPGDWVWQLAHGKACRQTVRQAGWAVFWLAADVVRSVQLLHAGAPTRR